MDPCESLLSHVKIGRGHSSQFFLNSKSLLKPYICMTRFINVIRATKNRASQRNMFSPLWVLVFGVHLIKAQRRWESLSTARVSSRKYFIPGCVGRGLDLGLRIRPAPAPAPAAAASENLDFFKPHFLRVFEKLEPAFFKTSFFSGFWKMGVGLFSKIWNFQNLIFQPSKKCSY